MRQRLLLLTQTDIKSAAVSPKNKNGKPAKAGFPCKKYRRPERLLFSKSRRRNPDGNISNL